MKTYEQEVAERIMRLTVEQFDDAGLVWFAARVLGSAADKEGSLMALAAQRLEKVAQRLEELDAPANKEA